MRFLILVLLAVGVCGAGAQCPSLGIDVISNACQGQSIRIDNMSSDATVYDWDFCSGDFQATPTATPIFTNALLSQAWSIRLAKDQDMWFGFAISVTQNKLLRFSFGNSLNNTPSMEDMGNPSAFLNGATDFQLYKESSGWFALVINSNANSLLRLTFGSSLSSTPTVENLGGFNGSLKTPNGIAIVNEASDVFAFVSNGQTPEIVRISFSGSISATPTSSIQSVPGGSTLRGLAVSRECDRWYGLVLSYANNKIYSLDFTSGISQPFQSAELSFFSGFNFPATISINIDGGEYFAYVQSAVGNIYKLSYGTSIIDGAGSGVDLGTLGVSTSNFAHTWVKDGTDWFGFSVDRSSGRLIRLANPSTCDANVSTFQGENPQSVVYTGPGTKRIALLARDANGIISTVSRQISISSAQAPDISFTTENICANHNINFTSANTSGDITSYNWDFGDATSSTDQNPAHQYATANNYEVTLSATASNGCTNFSSSTISVYNEPLADFQLPSPSQFCTNQSYLFDNTSTVDPSYPNVTWQWLVNGVMESASEDLQYAFTQTSNQDVTLLATIPGCTNEVTKSVTGLTAGPVVDFSFFGKCENDAVTFTNNSSGDITGYTWDFGDGQSSTEINPSNVFANTGSFDVTLTALSPSGCENTSTQLLTIYSKPTVDFYSELPPFSCSGTPTFLKDDTPGPSDSSIQSWQWNFGDAGSAQNSSSVQNPSHTYADAGDYDVTLTVMTDQGCLSSLQKSITVSQTPTVSISHSATCKDSPTAFTDQTPDAVAWNWMIGATPYTVQNPSHLFTSAGQYNVTLQATAANGCEASKNETITVPVPLAPAFSVIKNCVAEPALLTDETMAAVDPIVSRKWSFLGNVINTPTPSIQYQFQNTGNVLVSMEVEANSGCKYTLAKNIVIVAKPFASFTATPIQGGIPLNVSFTNTSTGASLYQWSFGDAANTTTSTVNPVFTYQDLGEFEATLVAMNVQQCSSSTSQIIKAQSPLIDAAITQLSFSSTGTGAVRPQVTILNNGNIPLGAFTVIVNIDNEVRLSEDVTTSILPSALYDYEVPFNILETGVKFVCVELRASSDVNEANNRSCQSLEAQFTVLTPYPNPANDQLLLEWIAQEDVGVKVFMSNPVGAERGSWKIQSSQGLNQLKIPTSGLAEGLYLLTIEMGAIQKSYRIQIAH